MHALNLRLSESATTTVIVGKDPSDDKNKTFPMIIASTVDDRSLREPGASDRRRPIF